MIVLLDDFVFGPGNPALIKKSKASGVSGWENLLLPNFDVLFLSCLLVDP